MAEKSVFLAYLCWLLGGVFGLHLFYLERDAHAFLTFSTLGGYGFGWLADITKIPRYVRQCNNDPKYVEELGYRFRKHKKPPFSTSRFVASITMGYLWGQVVLLAIPENDIAGINFNKYLHWFIPQAVSLGVWVVGNIGHEQGKPWLTLITANLAYMSRWHYYDENYWLTIVVFVSALTFETFSKEWRRKPRQKKPILKRISILAFCAFLYLSLWSSYFYFNAKIEDSYGEEIPLREAAQHFFSSQMWTEFTQSLYDTYQFAQHHGWYEVWKQVVELSDPHGEQNAYKVLGVGATASQTEITAKWRALSREFHPDKVKDPDKQRAAQEKFMEIQQAYEILSNIKNKRHKKNTKSIRDDEL